MFIYSNNNNNNNKINLIYRNNPFKNFISILTHFIRLSHINFTEDVEVYT